MLGSMVSSYRIAAQIGAGGMGAVAIKVLSHESTADLDVVSRFFDHRPAALDHRAQIG